MARVGRWDYRIYLSDIGSGSTLFRTLEEEWSSYWDQ